MKIAISLILGGLMLAATLPAYGADRFPQPDFESGYGLPHPDQPAPEAGWRWVLDGAAGFVAVGLAAWLALSRRSRRGLFLLSLASLAYFGFYRGGCVCPIGAIQNVAQALFDAEIVLPLVVLAFFVLPLAASLLFGRVFCSAVCPLGVMQDLFVLKPLRVPRWLETGLGLLPHVYLGLAVLFAATGGAYLICRFDPFVGLFRLSGPVSMIVLGGLFLLVGTIVGRPYCRFLCPYGALLGLGARLARWRVSITPDRCVQCRLCEDACPFGAIRPPTTAAEPSARKVSTVSRLLLLVPAAAGLFGFLGVLAGPTVARFHPTVELSEHVAAHSARPGETGPDDVEAFRSSGRTVAELQTDADAVKSTFLWGTALLGVFLGLVLSVKLLDLYGSAPREDYTPDPALCVACGRCYSACPVERSTWSAAKEDP